MKDILREIVEYRRIEVEKKKKSFPLSKLEKSFPFLPQTRSFKNAIAKPGKLNFIAEIKKSSPSRGLICADFNPQKLATIFEQNGASAISILTEEKYFEGKINYLQDVRKKSSLPLLAKDFIIDEYQIYEARFYGADAILLIANLLTEKGIVNFLTLGKDLGLDCLVEVQNSEELKKGLNTGAEIIGINNRNLHDFNVDINTTLKLRQMVPAGKIIISESGIKRKEDVLVLQRAKINAILIGQGLLESKNPAEKIKELGLGSEQG